MIDWIMICLRSNPVNPVKKNVLLEFSGTD
jgi:hypothetical protein